jgi:hypothetical protein
LVECDHSALHFLHQAHVVGLKACIQHMYVCVVVSWFVWQHSGAFKYVWTNNIYIYIYIYIIYHTSHKYAYIHRRR